MKRIKKYSNWILIPSGIIVILLAAVFVIASRIVKRESTKQSVQSFIFEKAGGEIEYESMNIYLLPSPHINVTKGEFSIPGKLDARFQTLVVYPRILPLLRGKVDVGEVLLMKPEVNMALSGEPAAEEEKEAEASVDSILAEIKNTLGYLHKHEKGLKVRIQNGSFSIFREARKLMSFYNTQASLSLPDGVLSFNITSRSDLWDRLIARGSMDSETYGGSASVELKHFKPHKLVDLHAEEPEPVKDSAMDLKADIKTSGLDSLKLHLDCDIRNLTLEKNGEELRISARNIDADAAVDPSRASLSLNSAELLYPTLKLTGRYEIDRKTGRNELDMAGSGVNVEQARRGAIFVAGEEKAVRILFEIVKGGTVPDITLHAAGDSFVDMWRREGYEIKGSMENGEIYIPGAEIDIVDASGDAVISEGSLRGTNLSGKTGNSRGYDGELTVGIEGKEGPLSLNIMVDGDVTDVPPVLERFIDDPEFLNELGKFKNLRGRAQGRLRVEDNKVNPEPKIEVTEFSIESEYGRVPYTLTVSGGAFGYEDKRIDIADVSVDADMISSSGISGSFDWHNGHVLDIAAGDTKIDLSRFYPWLSGLGGMKERLGVAGNVSGTASISGIKFSGPVMTPSEWQLESSGSLSQVKAVLSGIDDEISIPEMSFKATTKEITFPEAQVLSGENTLKASLNLSGYLSGAPGMEARFSGSVDAQTGNKVARMVKVPDGLILKSPATFDDSSVSLGSGGNPSGGPENNQARGRSIDLDIGIVTDSVEWVTDDEGKDDEEQAREPDKQDSPGTNIYGEVKISAGKFEYKKFDWGDVGVNIGFEGDRINIKVDKATLCGIATPGTVEVLSPNLSFEFNPETDDESMEYAVKCFLDKAGIISGEFDFDGDIKSNGKVLTDSEYPDLINSLAGNFELTSSKGQVTKLGGLAKFFSALNFGDIFRGRAQDFENGFPYDLLIAKAKIEEGKLFIEEAALDGSSLKIVCEGYIDILQKTIDLDVLVIPVMAIDSVIDKIPIISSVLGEKYVSLPVKVTGSLSDPEVRQISPHTLRAGLLGIIKETLNIPATIIKPVNKEKKEKDDPPSEAQED